jgi:hypothetical protein
VDPDRQPTPVRAKREAVHDVFEENFWFEDPKLDYFELHPLKGAEKEFWEQLIQACRLIKFSNTGV